MLKVLSFLTKSEGMEMQAFIDYYDNKHVLLSAAWRPPIVTQIPCAGQGID